MMREWLKQLYNSITEISIPTSTKYRIRKELKLI